MATLFRRANGFWYMVYLEQRRRKWLSTGTRCFGRATKVFQSCPSENNHRHPTTISDFLKEFEAYALTNYSKGTRNLYAHCLRAFIRSIGDKPMKFVTLKDIERYKSERFKTVSPVSVNVEFRTLKTAFNMALRWGIVEKNAFTLSKQLRVPIKEPAYLTKEEFGLVLHLVEEGEFRDLLIFAVSTMMRRGEIMNLEWNDIDFQRRLIRVRNKNGFTVKGFRPRVVPMSERMYHLLLKRKKESGFVLTSTQGHQLKGASVSRKFKRYVRKCALSEEIHFHSLRHTGATWLIQQDVPLYAVQKILGHSSPAMTQIYSHLSDQNLRLAIERIDTISPSVGLN